MLVYPWVCIIICVYTHACMHACMHTYIHTYIDGRMAAMDRGDPTILGYFLNALLENHHVSKGKSS